LASVGAEQIWVAVDQSKVIGLVGMILRGAEAEVEPLIVTKSYRDRGVGKRLLETVIQNAQRNRVRLLTVKPVARNIETMKFLHRQGFKNVGFIELFMDLSNRTWQSGLAIFDCEFNY